MSPLKETEVLVTGTFNIMHAGHVRLFEFAARYGKVTVGINADPYLIKKYGDKAVQLVDRSYVLNSCKYIDNVVVFLEDDPSKLILRLRPKIYIKGPDYSEETLPELPAVKQVGSRLIIHRADKEYNSSELIETLPQDAFKKALKYL
jgi:cytidyltransferase-like protein